MAILKSVVQVNNGNTGWTKTNVLNALEQTFTNLGFHGGSQVNGVVSTTIAPGSTAPFNNGGYLDVAWRNCGGGEAGGNASYYTSRTFRYVVTASGASAYTFQQVMTFANVNYSYTDTFFGDSIPFSTGTPLVFNANQTININGGTLVNGTTYYAIVDDVNRLRLATSEANALAGTAIDITSSYIGGITITFNIGSVLTNPNFTIRQSDSIIFSMNASGHPFQIQDTSGAYNSTRVLNSSNYRSNSISYRSLPTNLGIETGNTIVFDTNGWEQGTYYYVCQYHPAMGGSITVLPNTYVQIDTAGGSNRVPYWDYTVPASGLRSSLQLRVYRFPRNYSYTKAIAGVEVLSLNTSGWSTGESFTIPGDQIGGTTPASDLTFGVNNSTTPSIITTNLGAGVNFYQKFTNQSKAVLKVVNDPTKTYGTTYYGFVFNPNNDYQLMVQSGPSWEHLNYDPSSLASASSGMFGGITGLDISSSMNRNLTFDTQNGYTQDFATSSTPTAYPLKIITYRAQAPQDTNFAIIQFVQTINAVDTPYFTFFLHKGTNYGSGIWDLNHVWQGCFTQVYGANDYGESIAIATLGPTRYATRENSNTSVKRESFYGYYRDANDQSESIMTMNIKNNLFTDNNLNVSSYYSNTSVASVVGYYRNSQYDTATYTIPNNYADNLNDYTTTYSVPSAVNFYKPLKGIPLNTLLAPCPYYLPDDFVTIPFVVSPGATVFRVGDTITVSPSEIYEVVTATVSTLQTTYDGVSQNTSKGIAFCARTT